MNEKFLFKMTQVIKKKAADSYEILRGVSELTDRQGCAILALKVVPKSLIFA